MFLGEKKQQSLIVCYQTMAIGYMYRQVDISIVNIFTIISQYPGSKSMIQAKEWAFVELIKYYQILNI